VSIVFASAETGGSSVFSIGYVEFRSVDLVEKAIALSGTVVMGLPIVVQLTESERNRLHPGDGSGALFSCCI
jgi:hypothetical protein